MGFWFRKAINFGPFRINLTARGIGWSFGFGGFRIGQRAVDGRKYVSASKAGFNWRKYLDR